MIIDYAEEREEPCFKFAADWDTYGKRAGHLRNATMRSFLTHLLVFWDGESKGTKEMIENTAKMENVSVFVVLVQPDVEWQERMRRKRLQKLFDSQKRFRPKHEWK